MSILSPATQHLAAEPSSVRAARLTVAETVESVLGVEGCEEAMLATSELVTNAVEHGVPPIILRIEERAGHVRVEVSDGSPTLPVWREDEPGPTDPRGRGMLIVRRCTDRTGVDERTDGKAVWFEIDLRDTQ